MQDVDLAHPDYVPSGTAHALAWSPWYTVDGVQVAILAHISKNYVGYRRVIFQSEEAVGEHPHIDIEDWDSAFLCVFLGADAFIQWEDAVSFLLGSSKATSGRC